MALFNNFNKTAWQFIFVFSFCLTGIFLGVFYPTISSLKAAESIKTETATFALG